LKETSPTAKQNKTRSLSYQTKAIFPYSEEEVHLPLQRRKKHKRRRSSPTAKKKSIFHYSEAEYEGTFPYSEEDQVDPKVAGHLPDQEDLIETSESRKPLDQCSRSKYQRPSINLKTFTTVSQRLNY